MTSKITALPIAFDRPQRGTANWDALLTDAETSPTVGHAQLAANWRMDFRVEEVREKQLEHDCLPVGSLPELCSKHQYEQQCLSPATPPGPACQRPENVLNRLPPNHFAPNTHLIHLASLNSLMRFAVWRYAFGGADLAAYLLTEHGLTMPNSPTDPARHKVFCDTLANILNTAGLAATKAFAGRLSDALGPTEPHWWAGLAYDIDPLLAGDDWSEAAFRLGLGHMPAGEWLLAWRYPAKEASPWYRPSVLEAQDSPFHYPSPPSSPVGISMSLSAGTGGVCEIVHPPLKEDDAEEFNLGQLGLLKQNYAVSVHSDAERRKWFDDKRGQHRSYLQASYVTPIDNHWFARHLTRP